MDKIKFDYNEDHHCHSMEPLEKFRQSFMQSRSDSDKNYFNVLLEYIRQTLGNYDKAIDKRIRAVERGFENLGENPTLQTVIDNVIFNLLQNWDRDFIRPQDKITGQSVNFIYRSFRADDSIFGKDFGDVAKSVFSIIDQRVIDYFKDSDSYYLGKFITDPDTIKRISRFIDEQHIGENLPIGSNKDPKSLEAFRESFKGVLINEDWKITRILATTVNRLRNQAAVNYLNQAEVEEFEIRGINDRLQCPFCKAMQGRRFKVSTTVQRIEENAKSDPRIVGIDSPFISTVYPNVEDVEEASNEQLQSDRIDLPPYHPHCRDRIIAVL